MLSYSLLVTIYLAWLGMGSQWVGSLLWPAVVVHVILTVLLVPAYGSTISEPGGRHKRRYKGHTYSTT
jgi:hypothetical protein